MVKVITQETFDAVVKENVEEFGLELEEARKDAIQQFIAQVFSLFSRLLTSLVLNLEPQGVDLTNIVTDGPGEGGQTHTIVVTLTNLSRELASEVGKSKFMHTNIVKCIIFKLLGTGGC